MEEREYEYRKFEKLQFDNQSFDNISFDSCEFNSCIFLNCTIRNCTFSDCTFNGCRIVNPKSENSQCNYAHFIKCSLGGINWSELSVTRFAQLISEFDRCSIRYNTFFGLNLKEFDFSDLEILDSMFAECILSSANFSGCNLSSTEFFKCDLSKCCFRNAGGYRIDPSTNKVKGAVFSYPEVLALLDNLGIVIDE